MLRIFITSLITVLLLGCTKEQGPKVDIYLLRSFTIVNNTTTNPATIAITNAVLADEPLVADRDIISYKKSTTTFRLQKDIQTVIKDYGPDKGFAVTVDGEPVYYGKFHPSYLSSITLGVATIMPLSLNNDELKIDFATITGSTVLDQLDKRNDSRIIKALKRTGRLK